jgi:hypothetical protein
MLDTPHKMKALAGKTSSRSQLGVKAEADFHVSLITT